jgi:hypothetical protein
LLYFMSALLGVAALADGPADVVAGQIAHAERAHRKAELFHSPCRPAAGVQPSSSRKPAWRLYCSIMRLPMKPSQTPDTTVGLPDLLAQRHHGGENVLAGLFATHHFEQASSRWRG